MQFASQLRYTDIMNTRTEIAGWIIEEYSWDITPCLIDRTRVFGHAESTRCSAWSHAVTDMIEYNGLTFETTIDAPYEGHVCVSIPGPVIAALISMHSRRMAELDARAEPSV